MSSQPPPSPSSQQQLEQQEQQQQGVGGGGSSAGALLSSSSAAPGQFGDTTLTKVFVGGLAWETTRDGLRRHFEQFGEIVEAVVITDKATGRSKGYGFATFRDPEGARRACADPTPVIDGRRANCNLASLGVRSRPGTPGQGGRFRGGSPSPSRSPGGSSRVHQAPFNMSAAAGSPQHLPFSASYQAPQTYPYSPYGYSPYGQHEFVYPPNMVYNGQFYVAPPYLFGSGGGGPPPPNLGSPSSVSSSTGGAGLYASYPPFSPQHPFPHAPFPYPPFQGASHLPPHNHPPPSGPVRSHLTGNSGAPYAMMFKSDVQK